MNRIEGFGIEILQKVSRTDHLAIPLQVFYVSFGSAVLTVRGNVYEMGQEDIILVNGMEPYSLRSTDDSLLCVVSIDYSLISSVSKGRAVVFSLNSLEVPRRPYQDLREIFRELVYSEVITPEESRCRKMSILYELLDILFLHCSAGIDMHIIKEDEKLSDTEKLQTIIAYVNSHYSDDFSLRELAGSLYTSASTLSRFFKKHTGYYYADYLNRVRIAHAVTELETTGRSITRIAMDCGFSSSSAFSKRFHDVYGKTPLEYRKEQKEKDSSLLNERKKLRNALEKRLDRIPGKKKMSALNNYISVNIQEGRDFRNPWGIVLNISSLSALTRANIQFHMLQMAKELKLTHVKIWSVFSRDLRITDGRKTDSFNYSMVDTVLDVIVENKIAVYFDFGSRPDVIIGSGDMTILSEEAGVRFESRRAWEALFEDFVIHLVSRYGEEEIGSWIFDFCIDPTFRDYSSYYEDPEYDYQNVYEFAYRTLRTLVPKARIGGPTGIPNSHRREIEDFLRKCTEDSCMPDFVSIPLLPYQPDPDGKTFNRNPDPEFEARQLKMVKDMIRRICRREIPIYVTDWNISVSNRNVLNDSCMRGAYFCSRAHEILKYASLCSIWVASDWISNYYDTRTILGGRGGMLTTDSIRKPAYYALQFLTQLEGKLLYSSANLIVTMKNPHFFSILCSNTVSFHIGYYLKQEEEITVDNMELAVVNQPPLAFRLELAGLPDGMVYTIKSRSVNLQAGSIQDEWKRLDCESRLTREDIRYLRDICVPHLSIAHETVQSGKLLHEIVLDEQEFRLINIYLDEDIRRG